MGKSTSRIIVLASSEASSMLSVLGCTYQRHIGACDPFWVPVIFRPVIHRAPGEGPSSGKHAV